MFITGGMASLLFFYGGRWGGCREEERGSVQLLCNNCSLVASKFLVFWYWSMMNKWYYYVFLFFYRQRTYGMVPNADRRIQKICLTSRCIWSYMLEDCPLYIWRRQCEEGCGLSSVWRITKGILFNHGLHIVMQFIDVITNCFISTEFARWGEAKRWYQCVASGRPIYC